MPFGGGGDEAVALHVSLPLALALLAIWVAVPVLVWRVEERWRRAHDLEAGASGSALDAVLAALCLVMGLALAIPPLFLLYGLAFAFQDPEHQLIPWEEAIWWTVILGSVLWTLSMLVLRVAVGCWRGSDPARVVGGLLSVLGFAGLVALG